MNNLSIPLHHQFVQEQGNIVSDMDGDKVMMNIKNGKYYNLGPIGGRIWELLAQPKSAQDIVTTLMAEYEVEQAQCEEHVGAFLKHLMDEKLVHVGEKL